MSDWLYTPVAWYWVLIALVGGPVIGLIIAGKRW